MRIAALDVETTGLDPKSCAITQIAIIPINNGVEGEPFVSFVRPHEGASISERALEIQRKTYKEIMEYPSIEEVTANLMKWLDDNGGMFYIMGHNAKFDRDFLYYFFSRQGLNTEYIIRFRPKVECTLDMARGIFSKRRGGPEKMNLGALCKFFEIKLENAHDALEDIQATVELYNCLKAMLPVRIVAEDKELTHHEKRVKYLGPKYCTINEDGSVFINDNATKDKIALEFILCELHEIFASSL